MKNKTYIKEFAKYTSLNIIGMLSLSLYILADTFFVANGIGANGLAALNFAIPIFSIIAGCSLMLGIGGATKYAIFKSQNNMAKANEVYTNTILVTIGFVSVFFLAGVFFSGAITVILGTDQEIFEMTRTYLQVVLLFSPVLITNNVLICFIRNDGAPQLSMLAMVSSSFSNILFDYVFIIMLEMGMFGAALATGVASIIGLLIIATYFIRRKNNFSLILGRAKNILSGRLIGETFSIGFPSLVIELSVGIVLVVFNIIILGLQGTIGVAAFGVIANIAIVAIAVFIGIAQGIQPLISKYHGMGNRENVKAIIRCAVILMAAISIVVYSVVFFGAYYIADLFNSEQNELLQNIAVTGLRIYFIGIIFAGFNIIISVYFTSTETPRPAHIISVLRGFLVIVPMAFLLSSIGGIAGVWYAFPLTEFIVSGIGCYLYFKRHSV